MDASELGTRLTRHLDRQARRWRPQVAVRAPGLGVDYRYGPADLPFHSASTAKLVPAAILLQLVEQGRVSLDAPVTTVLEADQLRGLFRDDRADEVTWEHLVTHTSGVADYFLGRATGPSVLELALADPDRRWTPADLLAHTRRRQRPVGAPGERFAYSDTGFVVLGLALESLTGTPYPRLVHERVLEPLGMTRSFLPERTQPATGSGTIAPLWLDRTRVDGTGALTLDWAGGGLAATTDDYLTLVRALVSGRLVTAASWAWLTEPRHRYRAGLHYGAGAMSVRFEGLAPWLRGWPRLVGHLGVTAAHLWHDPVHDADIVVGFNDTSAMRASFLTLIEVVGSLRRLARS